MLQKKDEAAVFAARVIPVQDCPASYAEFLDVIAEAEDERKKKLGERKRERAELLKRAQRKDAIAAGARQAAHGGGASPTVVDPAGAVARLRRLQSLPPMLVGDIGGAGNEVRGEFLLRVTHLEICLRHPDAAARYALSEEEMVDVAAMLAELHDLIYSDKLPAGVWRRLASPHCAHTYLHATCLSAWPAIEDFFGDDHLFGLLSGYAAGLAKIEYEVDRHHRSQAMSALINCEHIHECLRRLYGLPVLLAWSPEAQRYADRLRAREILLDGVPERFATIKTARELECYMAGQKISNAAPAERHFMEDWLANK